MSNTAPDNISQASSLSGNVSQATPSIRETLHKIIAETEEQGGWDKAWKLGVTPWDAGYAQPPLVDLLASKEVELPNSGRALVPGCGRGYDPIHIAATLGLDTLAIDISETAVEVANENLAKVAIPPPGKVTFKLADFFKLPTSDIEGQFDLIYDYTFFVAIPPELRKEWGKKMNELTKPGGFLITLIFPIDPPQDYGPPFFVRPEHYVEVLGEQWEKVYDKVPERSAESHIGREQLIVYKKL